MDCPQNQTLTLLEFNFPIVYQFLAFREKGEVLLSPCLLQDAALQLQAFYREYELLDSRKTQDIENFKDSFKKFINQDILFFSYPIEIAVIEERVEVVRALITLGASTKVRDVYRVTPLMKAVQEAKYSLYSRPTNLYEIITLLSPKNAEMIIQKLEEEWETRKVRYEISEPKLTQAPPPPATASPSFLSWLRPCLPTPVMKAIEDCVKPRVD